MNAQERIAAANHLDAERNGRPTAHCLTCGELHCQGHEASIPAQRQGEHDEQCPASGRSAKWCNGPESRGLPRGRC